MSSGFRQWPPVELTYISFSHFCSIRSYSFQPMIFLHVLWDQVCCDRGEFRQVRPDGVNSPRGTKWLLSLSVSQSTRSTSNEKTLNQFGRFFPLSLFAWSRLDSGVIRALQGLSWPAHRCHITGFVIASQFPTVIESEETETYRDLWGCASSAYCLSGVVDWCCITHFYLSNYTVSKDRSFKKTSLSPHIIFLLFCLLWWWLR